MSIELALDPVYPHTIRNKIMPREPIPLLPNAKPQIELLDWSEIDRRSFFLTTRLSSSDFLWGSHVKRREKWLREEVGDVEKLRDLVVLEVIDDGHRSVVVLPKGEDTREGN